MTRSYARWQALYDKRESGDVLTVHEEAEFARLSAQDPACRHELEVRRQLAELDFAVPGDSQAIVETALGALSSRDKVVPIRPGVSEPTTEPASPEAVRTRSRAKIGAFVAAGVVAAAALFMVFWPSDEAANRAPVVVADQTPAVELTFTAGQVLVNGRERSVSPVALEPHTKLTVGDGRACVALDARTDVCLDEHTSIELDGLRPGVRTVRLVKGRVAAALGKRKASERFSIVSGDTTATAMGTAYAVEVDAAGARTVTVLEGVVEVTHTKLGKRSVHPSEQVVSSVEALSNARSTTRSEQARHWALLEPRKLWKQRDVGILHVKTAPQGGLVSVDGLTLGEAPLSVVLSSGEHQLAFELDGYEPVEKAAKLRPGEETELSLDLARAVLPAKDAKPSTPSQSAQPAQGASAQDLLARARKLVGQGRWSEAAAGYQRLRENYPKSPESHTVLVALGQLQLDRLGQPAQALRSFNAYLRAGGALSQEARYGKIRASKALGNKAAEQAAIHEYLKRHPGSMEAASLKRRLAELGGR